MLKVKILLMVLILLTGTAASGCLGKKNDETATPSQSAVTPEITISEQDLNTNDLNNIDTIFNDSGAGDLIDVGINESTFT